MLLLAEKPIWKVLIKNSIKIRDVVFLSVRSSFVRFLRHTKGKFNILG